MRYQWRLGDRSKSYGVPCAASASAAYGAHLNLLWIMVLSLIMPGSASADCDTFPPDSDVLLKFLVEGYSENRDRFRQFECRYRVIQGTATSVADAMSGTLANPMMMSGVWVIRDSWQRYELQCEPALQQRPQYDPSRDRSGTMTASVPCVSMKILTDGEIGLHYNWVLEMASVAPSCGQRPPIYFTPISMAGMGDNEEWGPNAPLRPVTGGTMIRRYGGQVVSEGHELQSVFVGMEKSEQTYSGRHWLLDPHRGYLPVEMRYCSNNLQTGQTVVTEVRKLENGGYFPFRSVNIAGPYANDVRTVIIIEVETLSLSPPPDSAFQISFPPQTMISNPDTNRGSFVLKEATDVDMSLLRVLHDRTKVAEPSPSGAVDRSSGNSPQPETKRENKRPAVKTNLPGWVLLASSAIAGLMMFRRFQVKSGDRVK